MTVIRSLEHLTEMALDKKATKEIGELRHLLMKCDTEESIDLKITK